MTKIIFGVSSYYLTLHLDLSKIPKGARIDTVVNGMLDITDDIINRMPCKFRGWLIINQWITARLS
jgi:hypothetical protein